jgi:hypothetical protein
MSETSLQDKPTVRETAGRRNISYFNSITARATSRRRAGLLTVGNPLWFSRRDNNHRVKMNSRGASTMRIATISAAVLLASTGMAFALDSSVTMTSSMSPDALWKKIGDFCGIGDWHPAVEKCVLSSDGKQRTLSL